MTVSSLTIDRSSERPAWARGAEWVLTVILWLLYLYMIKRIFVDSYEMTSESLAWMFDGSARPSVPDIPRFFMSLHLYGVVVLVNSAALLGWAFYNQIRFGGRSRRRFGHRVTLHDLAALYRIPAGDIESWQGARILEMRHEANGTLIEVTSRDPGFIRPAASGNFGIG